MHKYSLKSVKETFDFERLERVTHLNFWTKDNVNLFADVVLPITQNENSIDYATGLQLRKHLISKDKKE